MTWQKSILAYLLILLTGFSVFFSNKKYEQTPIQNIEASQKSKNNSEQEDNKQTQISESQDTAALTRAGVKLVVYNFFEAIPIFRFAIPKIVENKITTLYFAHISASSFHLEHLFFGIIAPNAP